MSIRRLMIANRGEIAARVIRSCRELGIETVLAASDIDLDSVPARLADRTVRVGPAPSAQSYLNVDNIIAAAEAAGVDALHPGYGFLSENADLARRCASAGITFIGPKVDHLKAVGDKLQARHMAEAAGLPVVPGGKVTNEDDAKTLAAEIGPPLLVKAVGGGGGRGMKRVHDPAELNETIERAMAEAEAAFGDSRIYLERFVEHGRHVEVQVLGDGEAVIHLGDRDCSIQRRYQKLVEEAPAPNLSDSLRNAMREGAVALGRHIGYRGAGTVEFLVDCDREEFFFLEMNARIQVEHPVTEAVTGTDLVAEQIAIAEHGRLRLSQDEITITGHAIECRINAEDPAHDFRPSPGTVTSAQFPAGPDIRVDTHIEGGSSVPPYYDSLLAKIITHGTDRLAAVAAMEKALANCHIEGVETNVALYKALMRDPEFRKGGVDTTFFPRYLENYLTTLGKEAAIPG